jgi:hypothetical protein
VTSERAEQRRRELFAYITDRPHEPMSLDVIAYAIGRSPGKAFTMDLSAVRHWASEGGGCITNCYWDSDQACQVLVYLPEGAERKLSAKPLRSQSRQARTRLRNLGEQASYTERFGVRKEDRAYGRLNHKVSRAVEDILVAVDQFEQTHVHSGNGQPH